MRSIQLFLIHCEDKEGSRLKGVIPPVSHLKFATIFSAEGFCCCAIPKPIRFCPAVSLSREFGVGRREFACEDFFTAPVLFRFARRGYFFANLTVSFLFLFLRQRIGDFGKNRDPFFIYSYFKIYLSRWKRQNKMRFFLLLTTW